MTGEQQKALVLELLDSLLKSWWTVVAGVMIGASVSLLVLQYTPEMFEAQAAIRVNVEKLPAAFVQRTVPDDPDLSKLRSKVLSDENLHTVIAEAFPEAKPTPAQEQGLASRISGRVRLSFNKSKGEINVLYRDYKSQRAAQVTNMLAQFFVVENKEQRSESARSIRESLEGLTSDVESELQQLQRELNGLLLAHQHELDTQRVPNEDAIRNLQKELDDHERTIASARRRLAVDEAELSRRGKSTGPVDSDTPGPGAAGAGDPRILQLEHEIDELLRRVTENHPDVQRKRAEIERLKESTEVPKAPSEGAARPERTVEGLGIDVWETRVQATRLEVERLETRGEELRGELARYQGYLANTPITQQKVNDLNNRIQVLEQMHRDNQRKIEAAKSGEQLEKEDIANPFVITTAASPPSQPVSPDRKVFLVAGVGGGLLFFVGPLLARGILAPKIMSEATLRTLSEIPVLVSIPVIATPEVDRRRRAAVRKNFGLSFLAVSVLCGVVALWQANLL